MELTALIEELHIPVHLNCRLEEVTDSNLICRNTKTSEKVEFPADTVLLAPGMVSRRRLPILCAAVPRKQRCMLSVTRRRLARLPRPSDPLSRRPHIFRTSPGEFTEQSDIVLY